MWTGELYIEDEESMNEFFESTSIVTEEEQQKAQEVVEETETVNWPIEIVFEIQEDSWEEWATKHPDEAKALEPHLDRDDDAAEA